MPTVIAQASNGAIVISSTSTGIQGPPGSTLAVGTPGQFLVTNAAGTNTAWATISGDATASVSVPGDLTVIAWRGQALDAATMGAPTDAQIPVWVNGSSAWKSLSVSGNATLSNAGVVTVTKINGASVPASGALTTGNALQVNGVNSLTYAPINLAGGANYVTGTLPAANQVAQNMAGEVTGTTAASVVSGPFSTATLQWSTGTSAAIFGTNKAAATLELDFGSAAKAVVFDPAGTDTFYDSGGVARASISLAHGLITAGGGGSDFKAVLGPFPTIETTDSALFLLPGATAPSVTNYTIAGDGSATYFNAPSTAVNIQSGGSTNLAVTASLITVTTPQIQWGIGVSTATVGTAKSGATLILQADTATTIQTLSSTGTEMAKPVTIDQGTAPSAPSAGKFTIYMDSGDGKLKAISSAGFITTLAV